MRQTASERANEVFDRTFRSGHNLTLSSAACEFLISAIALALRDAERDALERAAKVAEQHGVFPFTSRDPDIINRQAGAEETAEAVAAAIRALKDEP